MPRTPQDRTKINLHMQTRVLDGLKKIARVKGSTYSELIREACHRYVVEEGRKLLTEQQAVSRVVAPVQLPLPIHPCYSAPNPDDSEEVLSYSDDHADQTILDTLDPRSRYT